MDSIDIDRVRRMAVQWALRANPATLVEKVAEGRLAPEVTLREHDETVVYDPAWADLVTLRRIGVIGGE